MPVPINKTRELITITVQDLCRACSGKLLAGAAEAPVSAVGTDTRQDLTDSFFVALRGENFDGGEFAAEALRQGAAGVVAEAGVARGLAAEIAAAGGDGAGSAAETAAIIAVDDSGRALKAAAALVASRSRAAVVAITGSSGKTSTKEILSGMLNGQRNIVASQASFNNEVGVPLTLLKIEAGTEVAVVEMGMQAPGEIAELCRMVSLDVAVITNIGPAHLQYAGSLENIARGKAEIARSLPPGGGLVSPYGEPLLEEHLSGLDINRITFGFDPGADIHPTREIRENGRLNATISCLGEAIDVSFGFTARHQLLNAMAAIGVYRLLDLPLAEVAAAVRDLELPGMRGEALPLNAGGILLNDCYNANPLSMISSLEHLVLASAGSRTVALLGDMGELGAQAADFHRQVGARAAALGVDCLIAVGELARGYIEGAREADGRRLAEPGGPGRRTGAGMELHYFAGRDEALAGASALIRPGDTVLVKGSRFMKLEEISSALTGAAEPDAGRGGAGS